MARPHRINAWPVAASAAFKLTTITETGTFTVPVTGTYRIRCYGACGRGGNGINPPGGGGGGGGEFAEVSEIELTADLVCNVQVDDYVSFYGEGDVLLCRANNGFQGNQGLDSNLGGPGGGSAGQDTGIGDILHPGGNGADATQVDHTYVGGAGGTRGTEAGAGVDGGGVAGPTDENLPGISGVGLNSGGSGATVGASEPEGGEGDPGYITIQLVPTTHLKPVLTVDSYTDTTINVSWVLSVGEASSYELYVGGVLNATLASNVTSHTITGLTENTYYDIKVKAVGASHNSGFSNTIVQKTAKVVVEVMDGPNYDGTWNSNTVAGFVGTTLLSVEIWGSASDGRTDDVVDQTKSSSGGGYARVNNLTIVPGQTYGYSLGQGDESSFWDVDAQDPFVYGGGHSGPGSGSGTGINYTGGIGGATHGGGGAGSAGDGQDGDAGGAGGPAAPDSIAGGNGGALNNNGDSPGGGAGAFDIEVVSSTTGGASRLRLRYLTD